MREKCPAGASGMYAVRVTDPKKLFECMEGLDVSVACYQTSADFVLAGKTENLRILREKLYTIGEVVHRFIGLPLGFHSACMDPALEGFTKVANDTPVRPPRIPVVSTVLDIVVRPGTPNVFTPEYFVTHIRMPVLFVQAASRLIEELGAPDLWLELGPTALFLSSIATLPQLSRPGVTKPLLLSSLRRMESPWSTLTATLAKLYTTDLPIRWREIFDHHQMQPPRIIDLPSYPFQTTDFWTPYRSNCYSHACGPSSHTTITLDEYSLLKRQTQAPTWTNGRVAVYETPATALAEFIEGHMVAGSAMCPASIYIELALAAGNSSTSSGPGFFVLSKLEFTKPFLYLRGSPQTLVIAVTTIEDGLGTFNVCSKTTRDGEGELHCRGMYLIETADETTLSALKTAYEDVAPRIASLTSTSRDGAQGREKEVFSRRTVYDLLFPRVVVYSRDYQTIQSFTMTSDSTEGYVTLRLPFDHDRSKFTVHPIFVDSVLQVAGFLANMRGGVRDVHICDAVDTIRILAEAVDGDAEYGGYCKTASVTEGGVDIVVCEVTIIKLGAEVEETPDIVVQATGVRFKKIQLDSLARRLKSVSVAPFKKDVIPQAASPPSRPSIGRAKAASFSISDFPPLLEIPADHSPEAIKIIATACGVDPGTVTPSSDLRALGIDSLLLMEIAYKLQKSPPISFTRPSSTLALCHTVADILSLISSRPGSPAVSRKRASSTVSLLAINEEETIHRLLADTLGVKQSELGVTDDLESHGLDSLMATEMMRVLREEFNVSLPQDFFAKYRTVAQVQGQIWRLSAGSTSSAPMRARSISARSSVPSLVSVGSITSVESCVLVRGVHPPTATNVAPLFMIHDGSGLINPYRQMGEVGRPCYGIKNPYFGTQESWPDVASMGREYAQLVVEQSDGGPVILGGKQGFEILCASTR